MPCYKPWRMPGGNGQLLPCGQCRGCRAGHAREWAMRCMHEAQWHESEGRENCFVTLTYDPLHEPPGRSLDREAFPLFMKRLRAQVGKVRYYHVGEYGTRYNRPHYHALLFGWSPGDKTLYAVRNGFCVFRSEVLRSAWPDGLHEVGSVTPASAAYCTGYVKKRMTGSWAKAKYGNREPEYCTMSRRPGIGFGWLLQYADEVYPDDSVVVRGVKVKPPRYYDLSVERFFPEYIDGVKCQRFNRRRKENEAPERLAAAAAIAASQEDIYSEVKTL